MPINITFANGSTVDAAQLNALVAIINQNESKINNLTSTLNAISKSQLLLLANIKLEQTLLTNGSNNIIVWEPKINFGSILSINNVITTPSSGTYTIETKTIISADNAVSPRSKLVIYAGGNPVGISEDTTFQESPGSISNYRNSHYANATVQLNSGVPIIVVAQVWGASAGRIFKDINTSIKIWLEI